MLDQKNSKFIDEQDVISNKKRRRTPIVDSDSSQNLSSEDENCEDDFDSKISVRKIEQYKTGQEKKNQENLLRMMSYKNQPESEPLLDNNSQKNSERKFCDDNEKLDHVS